MFKLDGKTLQYGKAFVHDGMQYPSNWLALTSLEEKQAIGIIEVADPVVGVYDQKFYWSANVPKPLEDAPAVDRDGNELGYTEKGLKTQWKEKQDDIAQSLLAPSDWRVTKASELGTTVASKWLTYRGAVRTACNARQSEITAVTTVEALRELFFGEAQVQQTDSDGNGVVDSDDNPVMIANPGLATPWPELPS